MDTRPKPAESLARRPAAQHRPGDLHHRARRPRARAQSQGLVPLPRGPNPEPSRLPDPRAGLVVLLLRPRRVDLRPRGRDLGDDPARARVHPDPRAPPGALRGRDVAPATHPRIGAMMT